MTNIDRLGDAFRRRRWLLVQIVLLGGLAGALAALGQGHVYQATARIQLEQPKRTAASADQRRSRSRVHSSSAIDALMRAPAAHGLARSVLLRHSNVTVDSVAGTAAIAVSDASPERAAALATAYAHAIAGADVPQAARDRVTPAESARQTSPRPVRTIGLGLGAGALASVLLALMLESRDRRIRRVEEIARALGLPLLSALRPRQNSAEMLSLRAAPYSEEAEAYRILRANVELATFEPQMRVVMVTGALDGEGRTRVAANLALACALAGRRVALVDLHLRYPALAGAFDLEGRPGFTDVVLGHVPVSRALYSVDLQPESTSTRPPIARPGALYVLPAGPEPIDTADVVSSGAAATVVDELRAKHDLVFVDAPPLLPVADARMLSTVVDSMIVVTNLTVLTRPTLAELKRAIGACHAVPIGFVATGLASRQHDPYSRYYLERRGLPAIRGSIA